MIGFQIKKRVRAVSADMIGKFAQLPVANVINCWFKIEKATRKSGFFYG